MLKVRITGKKKRQLKNRATNEVRNCIRWLRGEGGAAGLQPHPFSMRLMAFDLERALADLTETQRPDPIDLSNPDPDGLLMINKKEAEALLFHYHKNGIPPTQIAAKRLEKRLCEFVGKETKDEFIPRHAR